MCILLVEDEPLIRLLLVEELVQEGWEVAEAENGDSAVAMIAAPPSTRFTMLITDVQMPGRADGVAVARLARAKFPRMPIILTTGRPEVLWSLGPQRLNDAVILKPFLPRDLIAVVHRLLALDPGAGAWA